jgi:hypothetical protein
MFPVGNGISLGISGAYTEGRGIFQYPIVKRNAVCINDFRPAIPHSDTPIGRGGPAEHVA